MSRGPPTRASRRSSQRRKVALDVDLNALPPCENHNGEGTSSNQAGQQAGPQQPVPEPIDVDLLDDDVVLSSPRAFAEAKRRNRGRNVVDVEVVGSITWQAGNNRNKRHRVPSNPTIINCESYVNLEMLAESAVGNDCRGARTVAAAPPPPPPPKEATFNCPVCMSPLVEETSTKCGHIFCKACIKASISSQGKCPTCRRKLTMKDTIRIYLPATS